MSALVERVPRFLPVGCDFSRGIIREFLRVYAATEIEVTRQIRGQNECEFLERFPHLGAKMGTVAGSY
jgi:hypothetical protein